MHGLVTMASSKSQDVIVHLDMVREWYNTPSLVILPLIRPVQVFDVQVLPPHATVAYAAQQGVSQVQ